MWVIDVWDWGVLLMCVNDVCGMYVRGVCVCVGVMCVIDVCDCCV